MIGTLKELKEKVKGKKYEQEVLNTRKKFCEVEIAVS